MFTISRRRRTIPFVCLMLALLFANAGALPFRYDRLTPQAFTVEPGQYKIWEFSISRGATVRIYGRFKASGGGGNDIKAALVDRDEFENYKNGHQAKGFYFSGKVTTGKFNVVLGEGNYVLVFDNTYSILTNKAVTADIFLSDDQE